MIKELCEEISSFVLQDTPAVLSVGDRTVNKGYNFIWPAYSNPYFITPNGFRVELEIIDNIPYLRRGSVRSVPLAIENHDPPLIPRRSRRAFSVADLGGGLGFDLGLIPGGGGADDGNVIGAPPVPPPPVLHAEQEAQMAQRRVMKDVALTLEHMLNHKPSNEFCDACIRGKMRDCKKFKGALAASR
eukprot:13694804-Heterocapsa_arctica.AAC.1